MANNNDRLGGYTLQELLGAAPISKSPKELKQEKKLEKKAAGKRGVVSTVFGAPFRLVAALIKLPLRLINGLLGAVAAILKLPVRLLGALAKPFRTSSH